MKFRVYFVPDMRMNRKRLSMKFHRVSDIRMLVLNLYFIRFQITFSLTY